MSKHNHLLSLLSLLFAACAWIPSSAFSGEGQAREGCHIEEITDQDGDLQILLESEWITMHIQPGLGSTIVRFIFRPTGNDILDEVQPKLLTAGGGLLQDNFWEQDWRYSEFRGKFYDYQIIKNKPDEVAVSFETKSVGWLQANNSGIISKLLSDVKIRRTVRLKSGSPYFLFDLELINEGKNTKLPLMWVHNGSIIDPDQGDFMHRPSARGIQRIGKMGVANTSDIGGDKQYVYDFNEGWSACMAPARKEGIVYLMDYDYINFMYNCGTTTAEWIYDNVLIPRDHPWKGRTYILPVMGLSRVDFANEHFILEIEPKREKGRLEFTFHATASYQAVKRITLNTEMVSDHLTTPKSRKLDPVELTDLGVAAVAGTVAVEDPPLDPLLLNIKAHIELPDGKIVTKEFQYFHVGEYKFGDNIRQDMHSPVVKLNRPLQAPWIPQPKEGATVNRTDWNVFAVLGNHSRALQLREAIREMPAALSDENDIGYTPGWTVSQLGLTDFPYDYARLLNYRVVVWANAEPEVARRVGASMLVNYLKRGGGLVLTGGDSAFEHEYSDPPHEINDYLPLKATPNNLRKEALQLNSPVKDHPIFKDIDMSKLPYAFFTHRAELKAELNPKVLLKVGEHPFIVELTRGDQRTLCVLCAPFGDEAEFPGKMPFWKWDQWKKLIANVVRYAGHDK